MRDQNRSTKQACASVILSGQPKTFQKKMGQMGGGDQSPKLKEWCGNLKRKRKRKRHNENAKGEDSNANGDAQKP